MRLLVISGDQGGDAAIRTALAGDVRDIAWHVVASVDAASQWLASNAAPTLIILRACAGDKADTAVVALADEPALRVPVLIAGENLSMTDMLAWLRCGVAGCLPLPADPLLMRTATRTLAVGGRFIPPDMLDRMIAALQHELTLDDAEDAGAAFSGEPTGAQEESEMLGISRRQYEILALLTRGLSIKSICQRLLISEGTAKTHVSALYRRLGARNRGEAIYIAAQRGARHLFNR